MSRERVALVTGAGGVLGLEQAKALAAAGWTVVATDRAIDRLVEVTGALPGARCLPLDVTSNDGWGDVMAEVLRSVGPVSALINNAGASAPVVPIHELAPEDWDRTFAVNARGTFLGTKWAFDHMKAGGGAIINISSIAALGRFGGTEAAYAASKAAVVALTRSCAAQYGRYGIRCNAILPGPVDTPMMRAAYDTEDKRRHRLGSIPIGRFATAQEVADLAVFLASERASGISGETIAVDGGSLVQ